MKTIRWGIIGCGDVTEVKSGPGFQRADHSDLVMVMRRSGHLAADYARRHGVPRWTDDAQALIDDPAVDAVYVATPPDSHLDYALAVARAGKPVYVEKPMARSHAECQAMIDGCREAGVPLFVAYYRRMLPGFLQVKKLVDEGAIGEPRLVTIDLHWTPPEGLDPDDLPWRYDPVVSPGGLFLDLASHQLDVLDYILGPVTAAHGHSGNQAGLYPNKDMVTGSWTYQSGAQGAGAWYFTGAAARDVMAIYGSAGSITFSGFTTTPLRLATAEGETVFPFDNPPHVQQPLIQTIVDELNGVGTCPSTGESAARTSWVIDHLLAEA